MKIKSMGLFILGMIHILIGIIVVVIVLFGHEEAGKLLAAGICLVYGANMVIKSIETKAQHLRRKEELKQMAELYGWDKEEE